MAITSAKAEFIVELKKIRQPDCFPASQKTGSDLMVLFASL
jgi:hypothetical protein